MGGKWKTFVIGASLLLGLCFRHTDAGQETNNLWFPVGEKLVYRLYWGIIPVGTAEFTTQWLGQDEDKLLVLRGVARTTSIVAKIYPVEDFLESTVDPKTFLPVRYVQRLKEGRHFRNDETIFDHNSGRAYWISHKDGTRNEIEIDADTRDALSLVYWMRAKGFKKGQKERFRVLVDEKLYELYVTGLEYQDVEVPGMGAVRCLLVEPKARFGQIFARKGRVHLWFSDDDRHICAKMRGVVPLASVKAILMAIEGVATTQDREENDT